MANMTGCCRVRCRRRSEKLRGGQRMLQPRTRAVHLAGVIASESFDSIVARDLTLALGFYNLLTMLGMTAASAASDGGSYKLRRVIRRFCQVQHQRLIAGRGKHWQMLGSGMKLRPHVKGQLLSSAHHRDRDDIPGGEEE